MSGALTLIPYIPSWRRRGKLHVLPSILIHHTLRFRKWSLPYSCHVPVQHTNRHYMHCQPQTHREIKAAKLKPLQRTLQILCECENTNSTHEIQGAKHLLQRRTKPITPVAHSQNGSDAHAVVCALTTRTWSVLQILALWDVTPYQLANSY
jgi:hypothetical protein